MASAFTFAHPRIMQLEFSRLAHHISTMENQAQLNEFDFADPADVFYFEAGTRRRPIRFQRFENGAEAVCYVIEMIAPASIAGSVIETDAGRFDSDLVRKLYDSPSYPLRVKRPEPLRGSAGLRRAQGVAAVAPRRA